MLLQQCFQLLIGAVGHIPALQKIVQVVPETRFRQNGAVGLLLQSVNADVIGGGNHGCNVSMPGIYQHLHLRLSTGVVVGLQGGIEGAFAAQGEHGVDEHGGAGEPPQLLQAKLRIVSAQVKEAGNFVSF